MICGKRRDDAVDRKLKQRSAANIMHCRGSLGRMVALALARFALRTFPAHVVAQPVACSRM
jgi:hypothetical protein